MRIRPSWGARLLTPTSAFALLLSLASCSAVGAADVGTQHHRESSSERLANVLQQPIPWRNLYALTDQLELHSTQPIARVVRTTSPNYAVGHQSSFHVMSEDTDRYFTMRASIRYKTPHLYMYVQDGIKVNMPALRRAANTFEHHIYPTDRALFGSEWRPGVDGDPHLTCLIGNMQSSILAGAFSAEDEYTRKINPYSNAREMFYVNASLIPLNSTDFNSTMAHEFQHMIHFHMHPRDNAWMNEGMSMLAEHVNGYPLDGQDQAYIADPVQLNTWDTNPNSDDYPHYGGAYLFLAYLYQHYGAGIIRELASDSKLTDLSLVNDVLRRRHIPLTANQVFDRWVVANWLDDRSVDGGVYWYPQLKSRIQVPRIESAPRFSYSTAIPPYRPSYVVMKSIPSHPFRLTFSAPATTQVYSFPYTGKFWWSNRGDLSDTRLERTVDLTRVKSAHLHYRLWYEIEKAYDYGYIEASTNGGRTWTTLPAPHTTRANPYEANYGNGYTGQERRWLNETVDLSRYAGKVIRIRFEYITDDEINFQGMAIRSISIPEIGYRDNGSGWEARGFVNVPSNAVVNPWSAQLVEYTAHGPRITRIPLTDAHHGSIRIDPGKAGITKIVAVISSAAPKTTARARYTLASSG